MLKNRIKSVVIYLGIVVSLFMTSLASANQLDYQEVGLLTFNNEKQLILGEYDNLGRATSGHIQLKDKDEPTKKREPRIKHNPVGWHNYKFSYGDQGKKAYLFNRGHLIGYQFSGLSSEGKNLVPLTAWTNAGNYKGMDDSNKEGMLYYENRLDSWLANHPNYWLDYRVTPIYSGDELIPRQMELRYVGLDASGNLLSINLGSAKESVDAYGITTVVLDNNSKNAEIDYLTGTAVPSLTPVESTPQPPIATAPEIETPSVPVIEVQNTETIVYVARSGSAEVYWYYKENMPSNTNFGRVVEMSEQDALNLGKRHTSKE